MLVTFALVAVVVALALAARQGGSGRGKRLLGVAAGVWVAMIVLAVVLLTVATLIFGR